MPCQRPPFAPETVVLFAEPTKTDQHRPSTQEVCAGCYVSLASKAVAAALARHDSSAEVVLLYSFSERQDACLSHTSCSPSSDGK